MSLLEFEAVNKRYGDGVALSDISMAIDAGEMVTVWGERRSGRSTLLRVAAGIEAPDCGVVRFEGEDLSRRGSDVVGVAIAFCRTTFRRSAGATVLEQLVASQFARRVHRSTAVPRACAALERVGAERFTSLSPAVLKPDEVVKVAVARALTSRPRLLVMDEPTLGVDPLKRDEILTLLRSLANEGVSILTSTGEGTGVFGADRVLSLRDGRLHGALAPELPELAPVEDLSRHRRARG
jgi:ABC-type multidrug transport system ATPase subunit